MTGRHATEEDAAPTRRSGLVSGVTIFVVALAAGVLFGVSAYNARSHGNPAELNLAGLVREQQQIVLDLQETVDQLQADQHLAIQVTNPADHVSAAVALRGEMVGPGITVTLDDAPADFVLDNSANVNAAVVHQQDVDAVMNALWSGGAEAMTVQGVRVTFSTPVRCIGNVILVGARSYAPPYKITALGDVQTMMAALDQDPSVALYKEDALRYQLGWNIQVHDESVVPSASDLSPLKYATVVEGA